MAEIGYYRPYSSSPVQDGKLPPMDAVGNLLANRARSPARPTDDDKRAGYIPVRFSTPRPLADNSAPTKENGEAGPSTRRPAAAVAPARPPAPVGPGPYSEPQALSLLDHQMRELQHYREAVKKLGGDVLSLREEIVRLENENSQLRRRLEMNDDATKLIIKSSELDGFTKAEIIERFVSLRQKLQGQTAEITHYRDKIQKLQNEMIKKNDKEKDLLDLERQYRNQTDLLQKMERRQEKMKKLSEICKSQEKVIEKMEKMLEAKNTGDSKKEPQKKSNSKEFEVYHMLTSENAKLRSELEQVKRPTSPKLHASNYEDREKMDLYTRLDRAEGRVMSLERQLADNAKLWGREKEKMVSRLREEDFRATRSLSPQLAYRAISPPPLALRELSSPYRNLDNYDGSYRRPVYRHSQYRSLDPLLP